MPVYSIKVSAVSWIHKDGLQQYAALDPLGDWLRQLAYGLRHTANSPVPMNLDGSKASGQRGGLAGQYRGLCHYEVLLRIENGEPVKAYRRRFHAAVR
jgi:hypothetical protein